MKENLLETFLNTMHKNQERSSKTASKTESKALFVDASFEKNTRAFQRSQQQSKARSLTLGEIIQEIHNLKKEISSLNTKVSEIEKGKSPQDEEIFSNPNIEIFEGKRDYSVGFRDMRVMPIQYQQHHVMLDICINGEMFSLKTLIDSGADVNILNSKVIPAEY